MAQTVAGILDPFHIRNPVLTFSPHLYSKEGLVTTRSGLNNHYRVLLHVPQCRDSLEETAGSAVLKTKLTPIEIDMEAVEEGSSDSEEVVFFNREQMGNAAVNQKLRVDALAMSNETKVVREEELLLQPNGKTSASVKGGNLYTKKRGSGNQKSTTLKQMLNQSLKNRVNNPRCEIRKEANDGDTGTNPEKCNGKASPLTAISKSLLDDSLEFAKRFNADVNFVHAKFAARKPLGLRVEEKRRKKASSRSRLKLERAILHADIVVIKQSLDKGGAVSALSGGHLTPVMGSFCKSGNSKGGKEVQVSKRRKPDLPAAEESGIYSAASVATVTVSEVLAPQAAPSVHANFTVPSISASSILERKVEGKPKHNGQRLSIPATKKVRFFLMIQLKLKFYLRFNFGLKGCCCGGNGK